MIRKWCAAAVAVAVIGLGPMPHAHAQPALEGPWVDETQQRIEAHRKTDVRIIVLNRRGEPVEHATVRIEQQRHDFPIGFTLPESADWPEALSATSATDEDRDPFTLTDRPLWRSFNAVALDGVTEWSAMSPEPGAEPALRPVARLVHRAREAGMMVRYGGVMSADIGRNPGWLGELDEERDDVDALAAAVDRRLIEVLRDTPGPLHHVDLYTHALDHDFLTERLGPGALRHTFEHARALNPHIALGMRFRDALTGPRRHEMVQRVLALRQDFVPIDVIAVEHHVSQQVIQVQLQRSLEQLEAIDMGVTLIGLEVGGPGEAAAAYNAEIVLRTVFASPSVQGLWLGPLAEEYARMPHAALIDAEGEPTAPGRVFDRLFRQTWWTDEEARTDSVGNVRTRIFAGTHRITAELPDGATVTMTLHVPRTDEERVIVLQP